MRSQTNRIQMRSQTNRSQMRNQKNMNQMTVATEICANVAIENLEKM